MRPALWHFVSYFWIPLGRTSIRFCGKRKVFLTMRKVLLLNQLVSRMRRYLVMTMSKQIKSSQSHRESDCIALGKRSCLLNADSKVINRIINPESLHTFPHLGSVKSTHLLRRNFSKKYDCSHEKFRQV